MRVQVSPDNFARYPKGKICKRRQGCLYGLQQPCKYYILRQMHL